MQELLRTNDIILIDVLRGILESERVPVFVADAYVSALEGSIGAFPRRLMVPADWASRARRLVIEAGYGAELRDAG